MPCWFFTFQSIDQIQSGGLLFAAVAGMLNIHKSDRDNRNTALLKKAQNNKKKNRKNLLIVDCKTETGTESFSSIFHSLSTENTKVQSVFTLISWTCPKTEIVHHDWWKRIYFVLSMMSTTLQDVQGNLVGYERFWHCFSISMDSTLTNSSINFITGPSKLELLVMLIQSQ